jgi:hypothetical protein
MMIQDLATKTNKHPNQDKILRWKQDKINTKNECCNANIGVLINIQQNKGTNCFGVKLIYN